VHPASVVGAAQLRLELGDRGVQRTVEILGAGFSTGHALAASAGDLHPLAALELATVTLVEQLDFDADHLVVVAFQAGDLLRDVDPEMFRDLDVTAGDDDLHADFPRFQRRVDVCEHPQGSLPG
jgi:hypothetical protein